MKIKNLDSTLRPREKAIEHGFRQLADHELIAIFLRTGTHRDSVLILAQRLLEAAGGIGFINQMKRKDLMKLSGIGVSKALELQATFELVRRINQSSTDRKNHVINDPIDAYLLLANEFLDLKEEHFYVVVLNHQNQVLHKKKLFEGTENQVLVDVRKIFQYALNKNAARILIAHNHPGGTEEESSTDEKTTSEIQKIGEKISIPLLDHIIFTSKTYRSIFLGRTYKIKSRIQGSKNNVKIIK